MKQRYLLLIGSTLLLGSAAAQVDGSTRVRPGTPETSPLRGQPTPRATTIPDRGPAEWVPTSPRAGHASARPAATNLGMPRPDRSIVYWDEQPDHPIWIRGADYKASFGPDGFAFIPFLGSQAPQNYPVSFDLIGVRSGQADWPVSDRASVMRDGDRVILDHGPVSVSYAVEVASIEQFFHLGEVAHPGPIELTLALETELAPESQGAQWRFENEWGGVTYGQAVVFDEAGQRLALETQIDADRVQIVIPADFVARAEGSITVDPLVSTFLVDAFPGAVLDYPDIAYSYPNDKYLMVYEEIFSAADIDIYSLLVDGFSGTATAGAYINSNAALWSQPAVAYLVNGDVFMVVANAAESSAPDQTDIRSRSRNSLNTSVTAEITIDAHTAFYTCKNPDIGGDTFAGTASYFGIVWERDFVTDSDIWVATYTGTGTPQTAPSALHSSLDYDLTRPAISKSTGGLWGNSIFNVAWLAKSLSSGADNGILVQQLSFAGATLNNRFFAVADPFEVYFNVDISEGVAETNGTPGGRYYAVAYDNAGAFSVDLGVTLCAEDQVIDTIDLPYQEHDYLGGDRDGPVFATTEDSWILGYSVESGSPFAEIRCTVLQPVEGKLGLSEVPFEVATFFETNSDYYGLGMASTVSGGAPANWTDAMLTYTNESGSDQHIHGARVYADETSPAAGYQYCYGEPNSTGTRALIYALGDNTTTGLKEVRTVHLPTNQFCYLLSGSDTGFVDNPAGSDGDLCLGGLLGRYNLGAEIGFTGSTGTFNFQVNPAAIRQAGGSTVGMAGQTWYFQTWFRDSAAGVGHSNFSNGVAIPLE